VNKNRHTDEEIIAALVKHKCIITRVAEDLGYHRSSIYRRMEESETVKTVYNALKDQIADEVQDCIATVAMDPTHPSWFQTARYYSRVKMGWSENNTIDITSGGQPLQINFVPVDADHDD